MQASQALKSAGNVIWSVLESPIERTLVLTAIAAVLAIFKCPPQLQTEIIGAIAIVGAAAVVAHGYKAGKALEGTVPDGSKPANGPININLGAMTEALNEAHDAEEKGNLIASGKCTLGPSGNGQMPNVIAATAAKLLGIVLLCGMLLSTGGCANNQPNAPVATITQEYQAYATALNILAAARAQGLISPALHDQIEPALNAIEAALATARQQALSGSTSTVTDAEAQVTAALAQLQPYLNQLQAAMANKAKPATRPATQPTTQSGA